MKKRPTADDSDEFDVDEPEEFEESGSDCDAEDPNAGKKRKSIEKPPGDKSSNKKKKVEKPPSEDEEDEENEEEEEEEMGEGEEEEEESDEEAAGPKQADANGTTTPNISVMAFTNGSFVVLKSDFRSRGNHPLWKIDGKALLQKYVPFEQDGKTLYKNTSTYSGWTPSNQDQYTPAPVTYVQQGKKEIIVEFNRDKVRIDDEKDGEKNESPATSMPKVAKTAET